MKLTKEEKADLAAILSTTWGSVELLCDGYRIVLQVQRYKGMVYRVMTYVNGSFQGKWMNDNESFPEQKFLRKNVRKLASAAEKAKAEKVFGKRAVAKDPWFSRTLTMYLPDWASGKAAISHLCKVCESVAVEPKKLPEPAEASL